MLIAVKRTEDYTVRCDICQQRFFEIVTVRPDVGNFSICCECAKALIAKLQEAWGLPVQASETPA
jgi:predicted SprT family Zn-dependent metalloprotease